MSLTLAPIAEKAKSPMNLRKKERKKATLGMPPGLKPLPDTFCSLIET
jgi:hypothetical protein